MSKLPHSFNWYYKSFIIENKCPFCESEVVYNTKNLDVVSCSGYGCYVSLYDCESFGDDGSCKNCSMESNKYCPIDKTSILSTDCSERDHPLCKKCTSIVISIPTLAAFTSDLVCVCDDCQKIVDFENKKVSQKFT